MVVEQIQHEVADEQHDDRQHRRDTPRQVDCAAEGDGGQRRKIVPPMKVGAAEKTGGDSVNDNDDQKKKRGEHGGYSGGEPFQR